MKISALPQSTIRLLGSSVVITKPCDVVKELLDNAIDAGASFVEIVISANHLDTIRVRDDGQGIDVEDFDALGRHAHTSKLRTFEELGSRARETLGFRGEALAAMNTLAAITVTTRTAKDVIATRLWLKPVVGGVDERQPASAPVGTTVQVTKLFETLPPRKQYYLKNSAKYMQSTKELLKAYALARPDLRLSFKVLGEATHCWSYAPVCATGVKEAAIQIFGSTLANSCVHVSRNSGCDQTTSPQLNRQLPKDFILEALIPKPGFDVQAVKGKGLYLSIDSRPISSKDAIAKKITSIYRSYLNRVAGVGDTCASIPNPFLQLNIRCPPNSYDANVTPLKDEVVFGSEDTITACFEGLCQKIYPQSSINDTASAQGPLEREKKAGEGNNGNEGIQSDWAIEDMSDIQILDSSASNIQPLRSAKRLITAQGTASKDQAINQGNSPSLLSHESCTQRAISSVRMRTSKTVNMSRTNSNSTDEDSTTNSVAIQVSTSLMTATIVPPGKRAGGSLRAPNVSASGNIERYLLSNKNEAFQIATDETVTKRTHPSSMISTPPTKLPVRLPLQPLTESMLNVMNGREESESVTLSAGSDISEQNNNTESIIDTHERELISQQTSPDPTPSSFELEFLENSSPHQPRGVMEWPTPPPSGNTRSARPFNSPFRPPLRAAQRNSPAGTTAHARSRLRVPEGGRVIPFTLPGQSRIQRPAALGRITQRTGLLGAPTSNIGIGLTQPQLPSERVHGLSRQRDSMDQNWTHDPELASRLDTRDDVSQPNLSLHGSGVQNSHIRQTPSVRTLPPSVTLVSDTAQDGPSAGGSVSTVQIPDVISSTALFRDARDITPLSTNTNDNTEDPRVYLIKRRRSQAGHGIARRLSSRRLPLEVTPHHLEMQNTSTWLGPSLKQVKTLVRRAWRLGLGAMPGDWGHGLEFKSTKEVTKLERRLQHAVEEWKQTMGKAVEVEYKLRSVAKGKEMDH